MFERFGQEAKAVLVEAQEAAVEAGADRISPGHILYGCAAVQESTSGELLRACGITEDSIRRLLPRSEGVSSSKIDQEALHAIGIDLEGVRATVDKTFGQGALESAPDRRAASGKNRKPPFTPQAKRSLALALRVAVELHENRMVPGHLLLGLLRLDDDFISSVIAQSDTTVAALSAAVLDASMPHSLAAAAEAPGWRWGMP